MFITISSFSLCYRDRCVIKAARDGNALDTLREKIM